MSGHPLKASRPPLPVLDLGLAPYLPVQALQARLRSAVADGRLPGVLLLLEHEPVITLGSRAGMHDLRESGLLAGNAGKGAAANADKAAQASAIPVVTSERGGQATLHAPGQLVSYPIVPIPGRDLSDYVQGLGRSQHPGARAVWHPRRTPPRPARRLRRGRQGLLGRASLPALGEQPRHLAQRERRSVALRLHRLLRRTRAPSDEHRAAHQRNSRHATGQGQVFTGRKAGLWLGFASRRAHLPSTAWRLNWGWKPEGRRSAAEDMPTAGFEPATPGSGGQCSIP